MEFYEDQHSLEQEVRQVAVVEGHQPVPGFLIPTDFSAQDRGEVELEQAEDSHAPPELQGLLTENQVIKYLEECDSSRVGELLEKVARRAADGQYLEIVPAAQTPFQRSSSKGKAPIPVIRFRAPSVSAPPPPSALHPALSSPPRVPPSVFYVA